jgi:Uncharacterized conserved protein.
MFLGLSRGINSSNKSNEERQTNYTGKGIRPGYTSCISVYIGRVLKRYFGMKFAYKERRKKVCPFVSGSKAECYLETFFSDRMHMVKEEKWIATPPTYECITTSNMTKNKHGFLSNLDHYIDMSRSDSKYGEVLTLDQLKSKFGLR